MNNRSSKILSFHPCIVAHKQIILGSRNLCSEDHLLIHEADAIILPQSCSYDVYKAFNASDAHLFPNYNARFKYPGKIGQARLFQNIEIMHPKTIVWESLTAFQDAMRENKAFPHKKPFLLKTNHSHEADGVFLIQDSDSLESALDVFKGFEQAGYNGFISQDMISSGGNVLRVVIIGHHLISYWKRPKNKNQLITTVNRGALIDAGWKKDLQEKGKTQVSILSSSTGINLAAIDLLFHMEHDDPKPLTLEINYYFGRRGIGGSLQYYQFLFKATQDWLKEKGHDPEAISLV